MHSPEVERALALRDVMDYAVRVQREVTAAKPIRRSRAALVIAITLCGPLMAFSVYSAIARPAFIWGAVETPSPEQRTANLRVAMFLLAHRVEAFRSTTGRFPATLADMDASGQGIEYELLSDSLYELRGAGGAGVLTFRSDESPDGFLGNSVSIIQRSHR